MDKITKEQAIQLIGNNNRIHTFRQAGFSLIGCDWDRENIIQSFDKYEDTLQLSGDVAQSMKHGLVFKDEIGYVFVETLENNLSEIENNLNKK